MTQVPHAYIYKHGIRLKVEEHWGGQNSSSKIPMASQERASQPERGSSPKAPMKRWQELKSATQFTRPVTLTLRPQKAEQIYRALSKMPYDLLRPEVAQALNSLAEELINSNSRGTSRTQPADQQLPKVRSCPPSAAGAAPGEPSTTAKSNLPRAASGSATNGSVPKTTSHLPGVQAKSVADEASAASGGITGIFGPFRSSAPAPSPPAPAVSAPKEAAPAQDESGTRASRDARAGSVFEGDTFQQHEWRGLHSRLTLGELENRGQMRRRLFIDETKVRSTHSASCAASAHSPATQRAAPQRARASPP